MRCLEIWILAVGSTSEAWISGTLNSRMVLAPNLSKRLFFTKKRKEQKSTCCAVQPNMNNMHPPGEWCCGLGVYGCQETIMKHHSVVGGIAAILTMLVRSRLKWCVDLSTYGFEGFEAKIQGCLRKLFFFDFGKNLVGPG